MTRSPRRTPRSALALVVVAALALGACGTEAKQADDPPATTLPAGNSTDVTTTTAEDDPKPRPDDPDLEPPAWAPAGADPAVVLESPGDGGTITVQVGDRVELPARDGLNGLDFSRTGDGDAVDDLLVPYGARRTFLAIAPGEIIVEDLVYDPNRSCVPPQPVAEFRLVITDGPRPPIGDPVAVSADDADTTIDLVPGQRLDIADELIFSVDSASDPWVLTSDGRALRPGTVEVALSTVPSPDSTEWISFAVRVLDPDQPVRPADTTPATVAETPAAATPLRSGPAPAPVVGAPANRACG